MLARAVRVICQRPLTTRAWASSSPRMASNWAKEDVRRPLHALVRVRNLDEQIDYYTKHFGMQVLHQEGEASRRLASLGYGPLGQKFAVQLLEDSQTAEPLDIGTGFGHFGIVLPVTRDAGPVKGGKTVIAFVEDPTGYKWELIQRGETPEPLCQVMLRVGDLPRSIEWYSSMLGMQKVRERDTPEYKYTLGFMGYGPEESNAVMELTYNYGTTSYTKGNTYRHVALSTQDVHKTAEQLQACGAKLLEGPALMPDSGDRVACVTEDPDGYSVMFIQDTKA